MGSAPEKEKFFADSMLGRLATWMRILGYDVEYERSIPDRELVERAVSEGRIILTRDTLLARRRAVRGRHLLVEGDHVRDQLRQVVRRFGIGTGRLLTRCVRCNAPLSEVPREGVRGKVPPYVFDTQDDFKACASCGRIYWAGTHRDHILEELSGIMPEGGFD